MLWAFWAREASLRFQPGDYRDPEVFHSALKLVCAVRKSPRPPWPVGALAPFSHCHRASAAARGLSHSSGSQSQLGDQRLRRNGPVSISGRGQGEQGEVGLLHSGRVAVGGGLCTGPALSHPGHEQAGVNVHILTAKLFLSSKTCIAPLQNRRKETAPIAAERGGGGVAEGGLGACLHP